MGYRRRTALRPQYLGIAAMAFAASFAGVWSLTAEEKPSTRASLTSSRSCHPSYAGHCLPVGRDLDCIDVPGPVRVVGPDVYRLDRDRDGIGCE